MELPPNLKLYFVWLVYTRSFSATSFAGAIDVK